MSYNFDDLLGIFVGPLTLLKLDLNYETTDTIMQRIWTNNWKEGVIGYLLTNFRNIASESPRVRHDYQYVIEEFVLIVVHTPHMRSYSLLVL